MPLANDFLLFGFVYSAHIPFWLLGACESGHERPTGKWDNVSNNIYNDRIYYKYCPVWGDGDRFEYLGDGFLILEPIHISNTSLLALNSFEFSSPSTPCFQHQIRLSCRQCTFLDPR